MLANLQQKRNGLAKRIEELAKRFNDAGQKWADQSEADEWQRVNADYDATKAEMEQLRNAEAVTKRAGEVRELQERSERDGAQWLADGRGGDRRSERPTERDRALALHAWARRQMGVRVTREHAEAARKCKVNTRARDYVVRLGDNLDFQATRDALSRRRSPSMAYRDLSTSVDQSGGYTVPVGFAAQLELNMLHFGPMFQAADVMRTEDGRELPWPTGDDTGNEGAFIGENATIGSSVDPSFGVVNFGAHKLSSKLVKIATELLEDSAFNFLDILAAMLGERIGRRGNRAITTGTGANQPRGVMLDATLGKTTAGAAAITQTELVDLVHSVDYAYRANASWSMHDNVTAALRKLVDSDGRLIWQGSLSEGQPDRLLGYPVNPPNNAMDSTVATTKKTVLFGDHKKIKVRQVREIRLRRLVERFADTDQEGFVAFLRMDSRLLDAGTAPIKYLQQA